MAVARQVPDISEAEKVAALRQPASFPEPTRSVQAIETHMSWVFLTDTHAYKLKKPVRLDELDFSSVSARHFYCLEELRLNRRLAPSVYLEVVPLTRTEGRLRVAGTGQALDWLVKMRRLPATAMLDVLLEHGAATPAHMRMVAARLGEFYGGQPPAALTGAVYRRSLSRRIAENGHDLCDPAWHLPVAPIRAISRRQRLVLLHGADRFDARLAAGRVIEAHGDLRPEHVYLGKPVAIIDCLEFSRELRTADTADEIGFLALECERAGAAPLGRELLRAYCEACNDTPPPSLIHFYQSVRACTRARLAILHLREARYRESDKWPYRARQYLALAALHLQGCSAAGGVTA